MTNLIERERIEYQSILDRIKEDNLIQKRARIFSAVASPILGASFLLDDLVRGDYDITSDVCLGAIAGFLFYQAGTFGHSWVKRPTNLLRLANPANILDNLRTSLRINRKDYDAAHEHAKRNKKYVVGTIDEEVYRAHIALHEGNEDKAIEITNSLLSTDYNTEFRPNLFRRIITNLLIKKAGKINSPQIEKILDAAYYARTGRPHLAEYFLERAVKTSLDNTERITGLCVYGNYLESRGKTIEARRIFEDAARSVEGLERFRDIPGSKNHVYVHESNVVGGAFVFKTGDDLEAIREEHRKTEFISGLLGNSRRRFVVPLALIDVDGKTYSVTRRAGNFSLRDYIEQESHEESFLAAQKSLESILIMHLKTSRDIDSVKEKLGVEDIHNVIERRISEGDEFISRELHNIFDAIDLKKSAIHGDFHPGNIIINKKGEVCIIDLEKSRVSLPYFDVVTLVDNYRTIKIANESLFEEYCRNARDGEAVESFENAMRNLHLAGVIQNLRLFRRAGSIGSSEESKEVKKHHKHRCISHLNKLQAFYSGGIWQRMSNF